MDSIITNHKEIMEDFTNEKIDTKVLPRYEQVALTALQSKYWSVVVISITAVFAVVLIGVGVLLYLVDEVFDQKVLLFGGLALLFVLILLLSRVSFRKKAYAFRQHDVIYRKGIIATNTMVIPYNRVQHVALHEGLVSRWFGLAKVEIFTAGGVSSDIEIPGILKEEAEDIKQLLMGKIQKQL
jgi:membrane protein YdbS with pleckstrin-like domain